MLNRYGFTSLRISPASGTRLFAPGVSESAITGGTTVYLRPARLASISVNLPDSLAADLIELHDQATVVPSSPPATAAAKMVLRPHVLALALSYDIPIDVEFKQGLLIICNTVVTAYFVAIYRGKGRTAPNAPGVFIQRR